jgi:hypothetical protein
VAGGPAPDRRRPRPPGVRGTDQPSSQHRGSAPSHRL